MPMRKILDVSANETAFAAGKVALLYWHKETAAFSGQETE